MTPDGKRAVSASVGRTLKVWDLETGRALRTLEGHSDFVRGVAVTPDGKRAVSASGSPVPFNGETLANDDTLKVWDLDTPVWAWPWRLIRGRALRTLEGHSGGVNGVAVTPDGKRAVSASDDETVKVWDLETGRELRTLEGHSRSVRSVAVTPDGKRAVSASVDKTLKVWNLETGLCIATFHCDAPAWCCACAAPNRIVAGDAGGRVYFLALEEEGALATIFNGLFTTQQPVAVLPHRIEPGVQPSPHPSDRNRRIDRSCPSDGSVMALSFQSDISSRIVFAASRSRHVP
jgi:WD40 repeat protein